MSFFRRHFFPRLSLALPSLSLSLSLSLVRAHTHTKPDTPTHTHKHPLTHKHAHTRFCQLSPHTSFASPHLPPTLQRVCCAISLPYKFQQQPVFSFLHRKRKPRTLRFRELFKNVRELFENFRELYSGYQVRKRLVNVGNNFNFTES